MKLQHVFYKIRSLKFLNHLYFTVRNVIETRLTCRKIPTGYYVARRTREARGQVCTKNPWNTTLSNSSRNSPQPRQTAHALKLTVESRYKQRAPRPTTDAHGYHLKPYSSCHRRLIDLGRHPLTIIGKCASIAGSMCI